MEQNERLSAARDPQAVAEVIFDSLRSLLRPEQMGLYVAEGGSLRLVAGTGEDGPAGSVDALVQQCNEVVLRALREQEPAYVPGRAQEGSRTEPEAHGQSQLAVPLSLSGEVEGVLGESMGVAGVVGPLVRVGAVVP